MSARSCRLDVEHPTEANMATLTPRPKHPLNYALNRHSVLAFSVSGLPASSSLMSVSFTGKGANSFTVTVIDPQTSPGGTFVLRLRLKGTDVAPAIIRDPDLTVTVNSGASSATAKDVPVEFFTNAIL
jgi:hypothetical protein